LVRDHPGRPVPEETTPPDFCGAGFLQAGCPSCRPTNSVKALKAQWWRDTKIRHEKRNEIFFAKASEAEIWTRVRGQHLTSFAGLHFENEPELTGLYAAEVGETDGCVYLKGGNGGNTIEM